MLEDLKFTEAIQGYSEYIPYLGAEGDSRLYHKGEEGHFQFKLIHFIGLTTWSNGTQYPDDWDTNPTTRCEVLAHGIGYFDGTRHLYFTCDNDDGSSRGYWYYPDLNLLSFLAEKIKELEVKYKCDRR